MKTTKYIVICPICEDVIGKSKPMTEEYVENEIYQVNDLGQIEALCDDCRNLFQRDDLFE